jgi:hypothetical protein
MAYDFAFISALAALCGSMKAAASPTLYRALTGASLVGTFAHCKPTRGALALAPMGAERTESPGRRSFARAGRRRRLATWATFCRTTRACDLSRQCVGARHRRHATRQLDKR